MIPYRRFLLRGEGLRTVDDGHRFMNLLTIKSLFLFGLSKFPSEYLCIPGAELLVMLAE